MKVIDIKGKPYITVNERVKHFIANYQGYSVQTEIISLTDDVCVMKTSIINPDGVTVSTGHAREDRTDGFINKSSYVENCETSSVGRALAFLGIGIDDGIASKDEIEELGITLTQAGMIEELLMTCTLSDAQQMKIYNGMGEYTKSKATDCIEYLKENQLDPIRDLGGMGRGADFAKSVVKNTEKND